MGENGPEIFIPDRAGTIIPNSRAMGGGSAWGMGHTFNVTINAGLGADTGGISEAVIEAIEYALADRIAIRRGTR